MFGARADSRYNGAFFYENDRMFKVIDEIRVSPEVNSINHELWRTFRTRGKLREMFYMPIGANALIYEVSEATDIELVLDMRESYDLPKFGRDYAIEETNGYVIITYAQNGKEPIYLVIKKDDLAFETIGLWEQTAYSADKKRNPHQEDLYVYRALKTKAKQLVMTFGHDLERAIRENNLVCNKLPLLEKKAVQYTISVCHGRKVSKHYTDAYRSALFAYDQLIVNGAKQFAGLPWFFQYWSRDELISVIGLMESGRFDEALGVLDRYLDLIQSDGRLPNRYPHSDLASADAIGWLFKRYGDYMHKAYTRVDRHLSGADYGKFLDNLEIACNNLARHHMREGLAYNASNETWMDTTAGNDHREGFRIEIQALFLQMFHVMFGITKNHKYKRMEDELKARVRADFFDGGRLADGKGDFTQRPNVFIAAYVYPELLSKEEWKKSSGMLYLHCGFPGVVLRLSIRNITFSVLHIQGRIIAAITAVTPGTM